MLCDDGGSGELGRLWALVVAALGVTCMWKWFLWRQGVCGGVQ